VLSLAEFHGLIVHLPLLAVPTFALLAFLAWRRRGGELVVRAEQWAFWASAAGAAIAVVSGLTVLGEARTTLRGSAQWWVWAHVAIGLALTGLLFAVGWYRWRRRAVAAGGLLAVGVVSLALAGAGGYVGGRMVFKDGVGVARGGQFRQTAQGAELLAAGLARGGTGEAALGRRAFQDGFRCSACHGMQAKGGAGPPLAGGFELHGFRGTHGNGLFPSSVVTDRMVAALNAWLRTLPPVPGGHD